MQSQPKHYICFVFIELRIFSAYLSHKQYCVHYLLALEACEHHLWERCAEKNPGFDKGKTVGVFGLILHDFASFISLYVQVKV